MSSLTSEDVMNAILHVIMRLKERYYSDAYAHLWIAVLMLSGIIPFVVIIFEKIHFPEFRYVFFEYFDTKIPIKIAATTILGHLWLLVSKIAVVVVIYFVYDHRARNIPAYQVKELLCFVTIGYILVAKVFVSVYNIIAIGILIYIPDVLPTVDVEPFTYGVLVFSTGLYCWWYAEL